VLVVEPDRREWRPYAVAGERLSPAFGGEWVLDPAPVDGIACRTGFLFMC
jgi:hypothetical protein